MRQEEAQEPSPAPFEEEPAQPSEPREEGKAQPKVKPLEVPPREGSIEKYDSVASEMPMTPADTTDASSARRVARKDHPGPSPLRPAPSPATDGDRSPLPSAGNHGPPLPSVADQAPSPLPSEAASNASPDGRAVVRSPDSAALAERNGTIAAEMLQDLLRACDALSEALLLRLVGTPSPSPASQLLAKALMVALRCVLSCRRSCPLSTPRPVPISSAISSPMTPKPTGACYGRAADACVLSPFPGPASRLRTPSSSLCAALSPFPGPASTLRNPHLVPLRSEKPVLVRNAETGERAASFWAAAKDAITDAPDIFLDRVRALPRAELPATVVRRLGTILSDPKCNAR